MSNSKVPTGPQIEFNVDWSDLTPYNDIGAVAKVDSPNQMTEQFSGGLTGGAEKTVGKLDLIEATLISLLAKHSQAVCRIKVPSGQIDFEGDQSIFGWTGTGFLVAPNILLTNYHVLNSEAVAAEAVVEFDYQITQNDLLNGPPDVLPSASRFKLMPDRLFIASKFEDFDYAFVWIDDAASKQFGTIQMTRGSFLIKQKEPTFILHHPDGLPKKASVDDTEVLSVNSSFVLYAADTQGGSSGSPVFDKRGRLTALHHAWWPVHQIKSRFPNLSGRLNDGGVTPVANEGIKLSAIAIDLERRVARGGSEARAANTVLSAFVGSDSLTGMFGSLGRHSMATTSADQNKGEDTVSAYEKVVKIYQGREQDIDIGAWNIEWLNRDHANNSRLERVATVIADLNLDIWALSEVSPLAVEALLDVLRKKFKQEFEAAYSEPDAGTGKQSTAIIWRPTVVECTREDWPDDLDALIRADSRDDDLPFEAVHGKIFNRYPGLFRIKLKSEENDFNFYLVPLHLKAKSEGNLRRELASKVLSFAVEQMINVHNKDNDWIILGDVNSTLKSGNFAALEDGGFTPLGAADEDNGAFTYLKAPYKSMIDNIFVSDSMSRFASEDDFYIIETDRKVTKFIRDTSDHYPIALRLSLSDLPDLPESVRETMRGSARPNASNAFARLLSRAGIQRQQRRVKIESVSSSPASNWVFEGRDKLRFFQENRTRFRAAIDDVNTAMADQIEDTLQPLSLTDVAVVYMAEAGIRDGVIAADFVHSNGEVGLFPLPSNISFWVGNDAPAFDRPMPLDVNIHAYLSYLFALRNKTVKTSNGVPLYPGLFREEGIVGHSEKEAKLLAGIVHGYFWRGNFSTGNVPFGQILAGYAMDLPVDQIMVNTDYVHAGKLLMTNRQQNIDLALQQLV